MNDPVKQTAGRPAIGHLKLDPEGQLFIEGRRCLSCDARMTDVRLACPRCGSRAGFEVFAASRHGTLHAYSIVKRSFPGVRTPFISAIVDLDDGLVIKGNLIDVAPDPEAIQAGLPVQVVFGDALGRTDDAGQTYLAYFFKPLSAREIIDE